MGTLPYALRRVHPDGTQETVSEHRTFGEGWSAGQRAVHEVRDHAYALYRGDRRLAGFGSSRLLPRADVEPPPTILGIAS
jgi:hypothetical protein